MFALTIDRFVQAQIALDVELVAIDDVAAQASGGLPEIATRTHCVIITDGGVASATPA